MDKESIQRELSEALSFVAEQGRLKPGSQIVLGCSTSEITGGRIGKASAPEVGEWVAEAMLAFCAQRGFTPIFQCCEHLNRSLVIDEEAAERFSYTRVMAIPQPKAGGSVPAAAWKRMEHPALVTRVQADAGLDVGDTLIGMHLKPVAVPLRGEIKRVGEANLVMAYTRLPFIGGSRAVYSET